MPAGQCHSCGEVHDPGTPHRWMRYRLRRTWHRVARRLHLR